MLMLGRISLEICWDYGSSCAFTFSYHASQNRSQHADAHVRPRTSNYSASSFPSSSTPPLAPLCPPPLPRSPLCSLPGDVASSSNDTPAYSQPGHYRISFGSCTRHRRCGQLILTAGSTSMGSCFAGVSDANNRASESGSSLPSPASRTRPRDRRRRPARATHSARCAP
jgi:hypothetical protein